MMRNCNTDKCIIIFFEIKVLHCIDFAKLSNKDQRGTLYLHNFRENETFNFNLKPDMTHFRFK